MEYISIVIHIWGFSINFVLKKLKNRHSAQ